jgi:hypothetical protein
MEDFDPARYEPGVARVLTLDGNGQRLLPLSCVECSCPEARQLLKASKPAELFPGMQETEPAMAGLWLYFSCFEEAHELLNNSKSPEGQLWHAILHLRRFLRSRAAAAGLLSGRRGPGNSARRMADSVRL